MLTSPTDSSDAPAGEAEIIPLLRTQIDAIDAGIARLVAERSRLSSRIQAARIAAGGVRVELGRERSTATGRHWARTASRSAARCSGSAAGHCRPPEAE
jgi:chorismate mutase